MKHPIFAEYNFISKKNCNLTTEFYRQKYMSFDTIFVCLSSYAFVRIRKPNQGTLVSGIQQASTLEVHSIFFLL